MYDIRTFHHEQINFVETEIRTKAAVEKMEQVNSHVKHVVETMTGYSSDGEIKISVFHVHEQGQTDTRMFYTYRDRDLVSYNKDHGKPESDEAQNG